MHGKKFCQVKFTLARRSCTLYSRVHPWNYVVVLYLPTSKSIGILRKTCFEKNNLIIPIGTVHSFYLNFSRPSLSVFSKLNPIGRCKIVSINVCFFYLLSYICLIISANLGHLRQNPYLL